MSWTITASGGHPDAVDWQARVQANGGTVSTSTMTAVSTFCTAINAEAGLRSAITRLNLFCGDNLNAALVPLYLAESFGAAAKGNTTDTNNNFVSGDYNATGTDGGLRKANNTNAYLATGLLQSQFGSATSLHMSVSGKDMSTGTTDATFLGSYGQNLVSSSLHGLEEVANYLGTNSRSYRAGTYDSGPPTQIPATTKQTSEAHLLGTRTAATSCVLYRAGSSVATNTVSVTPGRPAHEVFVFALNNLNAGGTAYSSARLRMYSIGSGITASQAAAFSTAVANFNTALGRT